MKFCSGERDFNRRVDRNQMHIGVMRWHISQMTEMFLCKSMNDRIDRIDTELAEIYSEMGEQTIEAWKETIKKDSKGGQ